GGRTAGELEAWVATSGWAIREGELPTRQSRLLGKFLRQSGAKFSVVHEEPCCGVWAGSSASSVSRRAAKGRTFGNHGHPSPRAARDSRWLHDKAIPERRWGEIPAALRCVQT